MTPQMFQCRIKPDVPSKDDSDAALATYIVRLVLAHDDCAAQLATIRNHLEINGVDVTDNYVPASPKTPKKILGLF